jgi:S-adenosylmethionine hydrolase
MPIITLLTDYGLRDSYVAEVKGAILKIAPEATIIDITHEVAKFDVEEGAFHLARSVNYFPEGTIHVGVVDPGVGGGRRSIIIEARGAFLVGPDNGLLAPAAERLGVERVYEIRGDRIPPRRVSYVFDGRDVFAPVAAYLAKGVPPTELGSEIPKYVRLPQYQPRMVGDGVEATVIHVDGFGNLVTNITYDLLDELGVREGCNLRVEAGGEELEIPYVRSFSSVKVGELLALVAGGGYLEISVNQGSARERLGISRGVRLFIKARA